ncbi:MAG: hypothetical protein AB8F95_14085 [Bacteroidia bacterium]
MGTLHKNAGLTLAQRAKVQELYHSGNWTVSALARKFEVNRKTIECWANRDHVEDVRSGPKTPRTLITPEYEKAIITYRNEYPHHGSITIAHALKSRFPFAGKNTVARVLTQHGLSKRQVRDKKSPTSSM